MILGLGTDIIDARRIAKSIDRFSNKFTDRIFTKAERVAAAATGQPQAYFAKRFAAKEALAKALGTGFRDGLNLKDIEILNDKNGKPYYLVTNKLKDLIKKRKKVKNFNLFLSIADEKSK